ncbi:MAG: FAD-dependent tricarballylate dehydrogenase TcuA [Gammaproteobacteria bacterium]|nr:FAD-dependent tricarballylate dehydrogenase TcuA [Gammaproteobacteria bacterium]
MPQVVVIGGGNAALVAAIAARERGADVAVLERAPYALRGGNSRFTAGAMRTVYGGVDDLRRLMPELTEAEVRRADFGTYSRERFYDDLGRVTEYRADPELAERLIDSSFEVLCWMRGKGVRFLPLYGRQSFEMEGKVRFWGGVTVEAWGGGPGLIDSLTDIARESGVEIRYGARASGLQETPDGFEVRLGGASEAPRLDADAVVLACGGFESNPAWRARYLGPGWDLAKVRGTRFNTGDGIRMAVDVGAATRGNFSGCHAVAWDLNAPEFGDLDVGDNFQKHSYPFGIVVNREGHRFVDEGADFRNYTYARYGREILNQPGQCAWQLFDAKVAHLLRDEYRIGRVTKATAGSIEALAERIASTETMDAGALVAEVARFNAAVDTETPFDPTVKDGRGTVGLAVPKSNWANRLDTPPFEAYGVTCGITFTFGGLAVDAEARVLAEDGAPIPRLFAAGELVGGLYYFNYPGGTGLTAGAVFGRTAGHNASVVETD